MELAGIRDYTSGRMREKSKEYTDVCIKSSMFSAIINPIMLILGNLSFMITVVVGGHYAIDKVITVGVLQAVIMYSKQFMDSVYGFGNVMIQTQSFLASAERVFEVIDIKIEDSGTASKLVKQGDEAVQDVADGVVFMHRKGFKYISADLAMGPNLLWSQSSLKDYQKELGKLCMFYLDNPELIPFSMLRLNIASVGSEKNNVTKTCSCGEDLVCVDWTGKSYACHLFSPVSIPYDKAERSNKVYDFSNHAQFISDTCQRCVLSKICNRCYGMNYLCTNDVANPSLFHCSAFKIMFAANCRFRLRQAKQNNDERSINTIIKVLSKIAINE